ncbi:MAG: septal ring lytic transglycosylase RlpA family protein [Rubrobacteraceae bacterium]|nr:septal ring lytic transglycosylase RlpA family protein [Rubrobacteraceae bacterium]
MVWVKSALTAVFVAAAAALAVSVFVVSVGAAPYGPGEENPSKAQYVGKGGGEKHSDTGYYNFYDRWTDSLSTEASPEAAGGTVSEGSNPAARAPARKLEIMEPPTPYSQVVDNATPGRFYSAQPWKKADGRSSRYGKDFRHTSPGKSGAPAWFKVKIPTSGHYTVYARWPSAKGNNPKTRFQISTASGLRNVEVNQRRDSGTWVRLGAYRMEESDRYSVQVSGRSKAEGRIVADAVMVVAGTQAAPHDPNEDASPGGGGTPVIGGDVVASEVIERARTHLGTPYRHSPPLPCQAYRSEDCSCFTSLVFSKWVSMPDNPVEQWKFGDYVEESDLRPGDLVFFKEAGGNNPITHVAIYSGGGNILHASTYWGRVVESPMKYVHGYAGARRLVETTPAAEGPAKTMMASYYGRALEGHKMANGQPFNADGFTAAHKTLPFGTELEVSYGSKSVRVTVTDRGPYAAGRDLDLSLAAARKLGILSRGVAPVQVRIV